MNREDEIFFSALALPPDERAAYLEKACAGAADLRAQVELLLAAHEEASSFMEEPVAPTAVQAIERSPEEVLGLKVGRYKLLQKIGEGGCGVVYMAEQQEPVVRKVALKVIKLGMDTKEVVARFEAERQALALMDHPNIARVLDAGATESGRPYFVMELVRGVPITRYCDEQNLATSARLALFTDVCHAVQHAHQKGIIHRDLKPSNILVTLHDGKPVPKVIDFGIAKATAGRLTDNTLFTAFEQFIGTPAYMSPEQAEMSGLDIDTRSDIYSLGVLLYELLTGRPPFDPRTLVAAGLDEIRRVIREVDPPRPSTRLSTLTDLDRATVAKQRGLAPAQLSTLLRGDLDWIVMRCLDKDRTRRYETANALALDVLRHLHDEPVVARPPSAAYRLGKLVRRNKLTFGSLAAVASAVLIGAAIAVWQAVRATKAETVAQQERDAATAAREEETKSRQLADRRRAEVDAIAKILFSDTLGAAAPGTKTDDETLKAAIAGHELTLREVLENAAARIPNAFKDNPLLEAGIRAKIGEIFLNLSLYEKASPHLQAAWEIRRRVLGEEHPDTLASLRALCGRWSAERKFEEAERTLKQLLAVQERVLGREHAETLETRYQLSESLLERLDILRAPAESEQIYQEAKPLLEANYALAKKIFGADDPRTLKYLQNLFVAVNHKAMSANANQPVLAQEALDVGTQLVAARRRLLGDAHPDTLETLAQYAKTLGTVGMTAEEEKLQAANVATLERVFGGQHVTMAVALNAMARRHVTSGRYAEAADCYVRFITTVIRLHGWESTHTRSFLHETAYQLIRCGQAARAETFARERMPEALRLARGDSPGVIGLKFMLGAALVAQKRGDEAEPLLRECLGFVLQQENKSWSPENLLGAALLLQKNYAEAEPLLTAAFESGLRRRQEIERGTTLSFVLWQDYGRVLQLYREWDKPEKFAEWQKRRAEIPGSPPTRPTPVPANRLRSLAPINLDFALAPGANSVPPPANQQLPGWDQWGNSKHYRFVTAPAAPTGERALEIASDVAERGEAAGIMQWIRADNYRKQRVRFRWQMKTDLPFDEYGYGFLRVERIDGAAIAYSSRRLLGSSDWREQSIVFDLPATARAISFGVGMRGRGALHVRALQLQPVGPEVPADNTIEHVGAAAMSALVSAAVLERKWPENLPFPERSYIGLPAPWSKTESGPNTYHVSLDQTQTHSHPVSLHLKSVASSPNASAIISQSFSAENYRRKRVRFSVWAKAAAETQPPPRIYLRVDSNIELSIAFDNSGARSRPGVEWMQHSSVLEVPNEADAIQVGFIMVGNGEAWFNDPRFEIVGPDVPVTSGP